MGACVGGRVQVSDLLLLLQPELRILKVRLLLPRRVHRFRLLRLGLGLLGW